MGYFSLAHSKVIFSSRRSVFDVVLSWGSRDIEGLHYLRTKEDAEKLKRRMDEARHVVVVGAGFLGLEFAAAAATDGRTITVIEIGQCTMRRDVSPPVAAYFTRKHAARGVSFLFGETITSVLETDGRVTGVETASGTALPADLVLVAVGVLANTKSGLNIRPTKALRSNTFRNTMPTP